MRWPVSRTASTRRSIRRLITRPPRRPQDQRDAERAADGFQDQPLEVRSPARVAADEQPEAAGQQKRARADGAVRLLSACAPGRNLDPAVLCPRSLARPCAEIAGEPPQAGVGEQIHAVGVAVRAAPLLDHGDQLAHAARAVLLGEAAHLGLDGVASLAVDDPHRGPVDEGEQNQNRGAEERDVEKREPERGGPEKPTRPHGSNSLRRARCGSAARRSPCRSCRAAGSRGRRSRLSAGRSGSPRRAPAASCG